MAMSDDEGWGQLVSLTDFESAPIQLTTDKYCIGRADDCDLSLADNKLVSGHHCNIEQGKDGKVILTDTSTNGTLLNMTYKLSKGISKELNHGDEFYIVFKKQNEELNVGFMYQNLEDLKREEGTQEYSPPDLLDATLEDDDCNYVIPDKSSKKRKSDDEDDIPTAKKPKVEDSVAKNTNDSKDTEEKEKNICELQVADNEEKKTTEKDTEDAKETKASPKPVVEERDDIEENLQCMICQEIMHDCISLLPCLHSFCAGCYSDWMSRSQECPSCRKTVERINKNHIVNNLIEAYLKEHPAKRRPADDIEELGKKNKITHDMLYPKEELKERGDSSDYSDTDDDDDEGDDVHVAPVPAVFRPAMPMPLPAPGPTLFGFGTPIFGATRAFKTVCRQCPDYKEPAVTDGGVIGGIKTALNTVKQLITGDRNQANNDTTAGGSETGKEPAAAGNGDPTNSKPSTSDDADPASKPFKDDPKEMPTAPYYICDINQNHLLCQCCLQPFPDFRNVVDCDDRRSAACGICYRAYCHAYWGCRKADCLGCLNKFNDMNFGRKALAGLILDNQFESEIFKDYIDGKGLSVKDVLEECCKQMDAGIFSVTAQVTHRMTSNMPVCYACGLTNFKQLAFQYRKTWKREELPAKALNRPDCYWGSKCRTQKNKPHHARNFNHVCDQTRQF